MRRAFLSFVLICAALLCGRNAIAQTTTPIPAPNAIDTNGTPAQIVKRIQEAGLAPEGRPIYTLPSGFASTADPNYSRLMLGSGLRLRDFVLGVTLTLRQIGAGSGCGLLFRANGAFDAASLLLIYDSNDVALAQFDATSTGLQYLEPLRTLDATKPLPLLLIVQGPRILLYIDGKLQSDQTATGAIARGYLTLLVYNLPGNRTLTDCRYRNLWAWTFDPADLKPTATAMPEIF